MSDFDLTGIACLSMLIYGFIAMVSQSISFIWELAAGIILFCFLLEIVAYLVVTFGRRISNAPYSECGCKCKKK